MTKHPCSDDDEVLGLGRHCVLLVGWLWFWSKWKNNHLVSFHGEIEVEDRSVAIEMKGRVRRNKVGGSCGWRYLGACAYRPTPFMG